MRPAQFLAEYWQKKPLLIRGACPQILPLFDTRALFALASRDDVESRLVTAFRGNWRLTAGPFAALPTQKRAWTLLVQGVNLHDARADALMRCFSFLPATRLDDLMISYAADGGGVGPHFDSYDVFLLQASGSRRWRWSAQRDLALIEGAPLKLLKNFRPTHAAVLEPGDMLYLPPRYAHDGVAVGACTTCSIGFRAPTWDELAQEFLFGLAEREWFKGRYADAGRRATAAPAEIEARFVDAVADKFQRIRWTRRDIADFLGRHFSEPKPTVTYERPPAMSRERFVRRATKLGLALSLKTPMLYHGRRLFVAGESFVPPERNSKILKRFANERRIDPETSATLLDNANCATLLHQWWSAGWITFGRGAGDAVF